MRRPSVIAQWLGLETGHNAGERIMELEVRSAMTLDANLKLRTLSFAEWQATVQSQEYREIENASLTELASAARGLSHRQNLCATLTGNSP